MNHQKHIETAIENVLNKVKRPERFKPETLKKVEPMAPVLPKRRAQTAKLQVKSLSPEEAKITTEEPTLTQGLQTPRKIVPKGLSEQPAQAEPSEFAPPSLYEAEDLFVPINYEEDPEDEPTPEEKDLYEPPFNLFEEFVETELDILLARYVDLCQCAQCRADIVAMALQQLPAFYVTGTRSMFTAKNVIYTKYTQKIIDAVTKSIHLVYKRPRSSCRKIKQVLWIKPDLEQVEEMTPETHQLFEDVYDQQVEVSFSDEVADIIQTLEQSAPDEEAQAILPVTSDKVKKAYQDRDEEDEGSQLDIPEEPLEQATMNLIDDWDMDDDNENR